MKFSEKILIKRCIATDIVLVMEAVIKNIRSVLISTKGKCDLKTLQKDYQIIMGTNIPFQSFGFKKLEEFLRSCPTLSVTKGPNGEILVDAIPTEKSAHISNLVDRQKTTKKKSKFPVRRGPPRKPYRSRQSDWVPASSGKKWQPSYQASSRPAAVSHNQIVSWDNKKIPPRLQRKGSNRSTIDNTPQVPLNPGTRAGLTSRSKSEDHDNENIKPPTPPIMEKKIVNQEQIEIEKSITSRLRLRRALSQPQPPSPPINGNDTFQQALVDTEQRIQAVNLSTSGTTRPRMRTHHAPTTPTFSAPTSSSPILFTPPQLQQSQIDELRKSAMAAVNPDSSIWNWSSSDESTSKGKNNLDSMSDKFQRTTTKNALVSDVSCWSSILSELKNFASKNNLGELNIKFAERKIKHSHGKMLYDCVIKISNHTFSSYPNDYYTKETAQMAAASMALKELQGKYGKHENLLIATESDILSRIPSIIEKHTHGVWANQIQLDYEQDYQEQLPSNWLKVLDSLPTISVENIENKYVLKHCKLGEKYKGQLNAPLASEVSVPSNTVKITEEGTVVQITCALSTIEVWCRELFTKEAEAYARMNEEMDIFYHKNPIHPKKINTGGFYVAYIDELFCRVRALQVLENEVMCFFIDFGDEYLIPKTQIYVLQRQFAKQQAQAFVCRLGGLEELVNICSPTHLEQITGRTLHATVIPTAVTGNEEDIDSVLTIILYDTIDDRDVNINQELIKVITIDSTVVSLDKDVINKVYVSHADQNGTVYVQPCCDGYDKFMDLMADLEGINFDTEVENVAQNLDNIIVSDQLYLTKWSEDERYYRCIILDMSPDNIYVQLYFVDYGNEEIVKLQNAKLFPLHLISDVLFWFPYQAIRVKINIDPKMLAENFPQKLQEILPNNQVTLLKILKTDNEGIHFCDFFKRSAENLLFSVNSALQLENEIPESNVEDGNNNDRSINLQKKLERLRNATILEDVAKKPVPSTGLLKAPVLPPVDGYFEVMIPFAVSPWNFFIQPYSTARELKELMQELQEMHKNIQFSPVQIEDIVPGRIYASKHEDGFWYRTSVIKVINSGSISVFYCDFGYYNNLKIYQLVPLDKKFMALPFQALKAKLHGVKPKKNKWSMEDCKFFEQLVLKRTFASTIKDIQNDELYKYDLVLSLEVTDTSSDKDIRLDELLIEKGIAVPEK